MDATETKQGVLVPSISKERSMFIAGRFISVLTKVYRKHLVSTDGGTWYPQACRFLNVHQLERQGADIHTRINELEQLEKGNTEFNVEDLFELASMAFVVEIALAVARKDTSACQIKSKLDLYQVLTNREMFDMMLEQGLDYVLSNKETFYDSSRFKQLQKDNRNKIVDYFMNIKLR